MKTLALTASFLLMITPGFLVSSLWSKKSRVTQAQNTQFSGTYGNLQPEQRRLVDEWFRQFNEVTRQSLKAEAQYQELSVSVRTTFEAVTHALMTSKLTDKQGRSLGTALDLVSHVETVNGKIPSGKSDLQFRVYVALKPTAVQTLDDSREFKRDRPNVVFHKGYPINFRQQGGVPSIQISSATDGKRADIDVDYRSSKIPAAAVNGHLTSANSDVRAGNNYNRHINRWSGFAEWWKSIFGLPLKETDLKDEVLKRNRGNIPAFPRAGKGKLEVAMHDFLKSWLVDQQPHLAVAYISRRAYSCIDQVASDERKQVNPGLVPYYLLERMKSVNQTIGKPARLSDVSESVRPQDAALQIINQPYSAEFIVFETPQDLAFGIECANWDQPDDVVVPKKPGRKSEKYYGASLRLKTSHVKGDLLLLLWAKESNFWKIVSWNVDPVILGGKNAPNTGAATADAVLERVNGDPDLITTVQRFLDEWFVKQRFDQAVGFLSQQCYPCVNLYLVEGVAKARNWTEGRSKVSDGMRKISVAIGRKNELEEAITSIIPAHTALKLVTHPQEKAYTLVSVPENFAKAFECRNQIDGLSASQMVGDPSVYGNYYGTIFEVNITGTPAALMLLWARENGQWKIIAYSIEVP